MENRVTQSKESESVELERITRLSIVPLLRSWRSNHTETPALKLILTMMCMLCLLLAISAQSQASEFSPGIALGQVPDRSLTDISGIAASRNNPGVLWIHNDLARNQLYAVSTNGQILATWSLGAPISDFEDIAIGPGPLPEVDYLYCGDIGDNAAVRSDIRVYRAAEPAVYAYQSLNPLLRQFPMVEKITLLYPDGSHNAESLMVDPLSGDLFIVTKEPNRSRIYQAERSALQHDATVTLTLVHELDFHIASSAGISPDGSEIIIRQEEFAKVWQRAPGQSIAQALATTPKNVPVIGTPTEPNGEGVAFAGDGTGYFTISEGRNPVIYFFARTNIARPSESRLLFHRGSAWRYLDDGSDQGSTWLAPGFDASDWRIGSAQFGHGEGDEQTTINIGPGQQTNLVTIYFRGTFLAEAPSKQSRTKISVLYEGGFAVYLNGVEILRRNLVLDAKFNNFASPGATNLANIWQSFYVTDGLLTGTNTIAVECHRSSPLQNTFSFDLQIQTAEPLVLLQFLSPPKRISETSWLVDFQSSTEETVFLQGSSNLVHWIQLDTGRPTNQLGSFTISLDPGAHKMFYRLQR